MKISPYILFIILFFGISPFYNIAKSSDQVLNIKQYTIEDGLSQTSVNCLIQDSKGYIWVGTQDGLNKFDGYSFIKFRNDPSDSISLSNNYINCIAEDTNGNIWIGTNDGLNMYNVYTKQFAHYLIDLSTTNSIQENEIYYIYPDKQGYIWIKTENFLSRLNPKSGKFRHYEHFNDVFNFISVNTKFSIFEDHKEQLWIGTKDGLNYFDRKLEIFKRYSHDPNNNKSISNDRINTIFEDNQNNLWIGTEEGLNIFNWETEQFTRFYSKHNDKNSLSHNVVNAIFEDNNGELWIATDDGLNKYNKQTRTFTTYHQFLSKNEIVNITTFTSIIQDETDLMWVGTFQGLVKIEKNIKKFKLFSTDSKNKPLFSNNYITALLKKNDFIWVGTWGTGLYKFNPVTKRNIHFTSENSSLSDDYVHKIYEDHNGDLWIGTQDGINKYDYKTNSLNQVKRNDIFNVFKKNRIYDIIEDSENNLWVAAKYGLHKITNDTLISYINIPDDSTSLSSNEIHALLIDSKNNFWLATNKGLNLFDFKTGLVKRYMKLQTYCDDCISSHEVLSLCEDTANNCLWIGTVAGLNKFDLETEQFKVFNEKDGLPNSLIYSVILDNSGNLWLSTNKGVSKMNTKDLEFTNFGIVDGLQNFEFIHGAYHKSSSGELFFGGISGYNSFFPDSIKKNEHIPKIEITSVELLTNRVSQNLAIGKNNEIEIRDKNNLITIGFSALDYTSPEKNNYAYKLEGVEEEWINLGKRRYATFSLPSGKYTFRVKGSNSDNVWNEEGASLKINVLTPYWKTNVAYVAYAIMLGGLLFWFFQYRTRSLRKSNQELKEKELTAKQVAIQKEELTIKNKNITDSIVYAKRIQEALMPSMNSFNSILPSSFILHKPKDIVSGDFYWINERNNKIFVAVVDCTGHGVPGAFMSIIGFELLRKITDDLGVESADEILQELNDGVAKTFGKATSNTRLKDGMDIALCVIDKKKSEIEFAGAFRPLYFIRDNKLEEIRGDRFSVGLLEEGETEKINKTVIKFNKNDVFYLFSDGYADQFGGAEGKKYKYRRFRHILLTIHKLPLDQQKTYLDRSFEDWKGNLEQVDDVLIMGFRPDMG